jgi:hypothetical protein
MTCERCASLERALDQAVLMAASAQPICDGRNCQQDVDWDGLPEDAAAVCAGCIRDRLDAAG